MKDSASREAMTPINWRVSADLRDLVLVAAQKSSARSVSDWARAVLHDAALGALEGVDVNGVRWVRVDPMVGSMVEQAMAQAQYEGDMAGWVTEALEAAAHRELALARRRQVAPVGVGGGSLYTGQAGHCVHPTTARRRTASAWFCTVCGLRVRVLM